MLSVSLAMENVLPSILLGSPKKRRSMLATGCQRSTRMGLASRTTMTRIVVMQEVAQALPKVRFIPCFPVVNLVDAV